MYIKWTKGWRLKRERGTNRAGTRCRSWRILTLQGMKKRRERKKTIDRCLARQLKGNQ